MARLLLMPNTLDLGCEPVPLDQVLPAGVMAQAARLEHWIAEDAKSARAFLKRVAAVVPLAQPLQALNIRELPRPAKGARAAGSTPHQDNEARVMADLLQPLAQGQDMGLISEAGLPAVADPGSAVVAQAHRMGAAVLPLSGPNSMMLALAASGLQGQSFAFVGYLPQDAGARAVRVRDLQARSRREQQTQILIETPYRNAAVMAALAEHLDPQTRLSVAHGLSLPRGWCRMQLVAHWRQAMPSFDKGVPTVFCFQA